jgi:hypothetical protein
MDDGCEFQTSDNPVCCTNANARFIMPADPSNVLTLPLDNKHKLFLMPFADKGSKHLLMRHNVTGTFCFTEKLTTNHQQSKNAERFVLGTDFALKDFIRDKDKYDKPLTKEQEESFKKIEEAFKRIQDLEI